MKTEITAFDLYFLAKQLQKLVGERLEKFHVLDERKILMSFTSKTLLQAEPGKIWTPLTKPETPEKIHPFAALVRKNIGNSRIVKIEQVCSERILALHAERSNRHYVLYLEVFARGNAILCDANHTVIGALATNNRVQKAQTYQLPEGTDTFHMDEKTFAKKFVQSTENVSKTLAVQFGLGRTLAEELCVRCGIPANDKVSEEHAHETYHALQEMLKQEPSPQLVYDNSILIDATPIPFQLHAGRKRENVEDFGKALAMVFSLPATAVREQKLEPVKKQVDRINTMITLQQQNLAKLENEAETARKKAEYIYENYQLVKQLLSDIIEAKKKLSWKEIKEKFKQVREINEATGDITIDL